MINKGNIDLKSRIAWALLAGFIVVALVLSGCGSAPKQNKVYHVGILSGLPVFASTTDGIKAKLTELGYVENQNIFYDVQDGKNDRTLEATILQKFIADKVDLVVAFPSDEAFLAKKVLASSNIPLVFAQTNIEGSDIVKSVREPGGNVTGVRYPGPDLAIKRFEILQALAPQAKRIWVPYSKDSAIVQPQLDVLRPAAAAAGITLVESPFANADELKADLAARASSADIGIDAILLISEPLVRTPDAFPAVAQFALDHKLPWGGTYTSMSGFTNQFGVATDNIAVGGLVAQLMDKIFKGVPAGTIPVVSAESYFTLDYKATQAMGLTVPEDLLSQANKIIR